MQDKSTNQTIKLRPYQVEAIDKIDAKFREGKKRIILYSMMGSGKTTMCAWMIKRSLEYEYPCVFIVRGRELVKNASETLDRFGIDHSINMSGHWRYNQSKLVQVCSIDTLKSRKNYPFLGQEPLIFLDESHRDYSDAFAFYPNAFFIGMSGSPYNDNSMYNDYVTPIEGYELRDQGFLVKEKVFCPHIIDVSGVKKTRGDFDKKQLESVVTQSKIVGNIVDDWKKYGENSSTLCFCVSIEHSLQMKQAFIDAGVPAMQCDASSTDVERKSAKEKLESGEVKVVTNVDIFSTGWDYPALGCVIMARPTHSLIWWLQSAGRGIRSSPGKEKCIIIDSAANIYRHGPIYRIRDISFEKPEKKKKKEMDNKVCTCEDCYYVFDPEEHDACPECGWVKPKQIREVKTADGSLAEYQHSTEEEKEIKYLAMRSDYYKLEWVRKAKKLKPDWSLIQIKKKHPDSFHLAGRFAVVPEYLATEFTINIGKSDKPLSTIDYFVGGNQGDAFPALTSNKPVDH